MNARFWSKVNRPGVDECWLWTAQKTNGYGRFRVGAKKLMAHRVAYTLVTGPIPSDRIVLHSCDTPSCVNPKHLRLGTPLENMKEKEAKGRGRWLSGEDHPAARLSDARVNEIRRLIDSGSTQRSVAERFGLSRSHVSNIYLKLRRSGGNR